MLKSIVTAVIALVALMSTNHVLAGTDAECPRTLGSDNVFAPPWPQSENWYGSESLAVVLPDEGILAVTGPTARIAAKLFWWSIGFEPGMETGMKVEIVNLHGKPNDAKVKGVTNAKAESLDGSAILTGIDFPSPGCWQITGVYSGQSLTFVVETVDAETYASLF